MTTTQTDAIMALADRYAFHIPGSQHSDEARAVLLAALQEQAREGEAGLSNLSANAQSRIRKWIADGTFVERAIGVIRDQERELMAYEKAAAIAMKRGEA